MALDPDAEGSQSCYLKFCLRVALKPKGNTLWRRAPTEIRRVTTGASPCLHTTLALGVRSCTPGSAALGWGLRKSCARFSANSGQSGWGADEGHNFRACSHCFMCRNLPMLLVSMLETYGRQGYRMLQVGVVGRRTETQNHRLGCRLTAFLLAARLYDRAEIVPPPRPS